MLVLDASFSVPLFVSDARSSQARVVLQGLVAQGDAFIAPTLWSYEVTSSLQKLRHFGHISDAELEYAIDTMASFEISLIHPDHLLIGHAVVWSHRLRRASTYDSFYLALAQDRGCDLWTADSRLAHAVKESWVRLLA